MARFSELGQRAGVHPAELLTKRDGAVAELHTLRTVPGHHESMLRSQFNESTELWQGIGLVDWEESLSAFQEDKELFLTTLATSVLHRMPLDDPLTLARIVLFDYTRIPLSSETADLATRQADATRRAQHGNEELSYFVLRFAHMWFADMEPQELYRALLVEWQAVKSQYASVSEWQSRHVRAVRTMLYTCFAIQYPLYHRLIEIDCSITSQSACCERWFSQMNLIKTKGRNRLGRGLLEKLMMITINGPEPKDVDFPAILKVWKDASTRGRYNGAWKADMSD